MSNTIVADIQHLAELIRGIRIAIMTTVCADGSLRSRPMAVLESEFDGTLWFFTRVDSMKVAEVADEGQVNLSYADPAGVRFISISGRATVDLDPQKIEKLWTADLEPWFPGGLNDPQLGLLRVDADKWESWETQSGVMVTLEGSLKAPPAEFVHEHDDHRRLDLSGVWVSQDVGNSQTRNDPK